MDSLMTNSILTMSPPDTSLPHPWLHLPTLSVGRSSIQPSSPYLHYSTVQPVPTAQYIVQPVHAVQYSTVPCTWIRCPRFADLRSPAPWWRRGPGWSKQTWQYTKHIITKYWPVVLTIMWSSVKFSLSLLEESKAVITLPVWMLASFISD